MVFWLFFGEVERRRGLEIVFCVKFCTVCSALCKLFLFGLYVCRFRDEYIDILEIG